MTFVKNDCSKLRSSFSALITFLRACLFCLTAAKNLPTFLPSAEIDPSFSEFNIDYLKIAPIAIVYIPFVAYLMAAVVAYWAILPKLFWIKEKPCSAS